MHPQVSTWNTSHWLLTKQVPQIFHSPVTTKIQPKQENEKRKIDMRQTDLLCQENWPFAVSPTFPAWIHCHRELLPLSLPRHLLECPWRLDVFGGGMKVKVGWDGDVCNYPWFLTRCRNRVFRKARDKKTRETYRQLCPKYAWLHWRILRCVLWESHRFNRDLAARKFWHW